MTGLLKRVMGSTCRWLYSCNEVIVFGARSWDEAQEFPVDTEVIHVKHDATDRSLPRLAPGLARTLSRRLTWRSRSNDACYLLLVDGQGVGYGWIRSTEKVDIEEIGLSLLLDSSQICLFDFYIDASFRGLGLYTNFLRELRRRFKNVSALIYAESWNVASLAGISAAGFTPLASVCGICLFGRRFPTGLRASPNCVTGKTILSGNDCNAKSGVSIRSCTKLKII